MSSAVSQYKKIKANVEALPFGVGSNIVVPMARWLLDGLACRGPMVRFKQKRDAKREALRIEAKISRGVKKAVIVYDTACSPPTYGDYLLVILLARYFQARDLDIEFYIVSSEFRYDWDALNTNEMLALIDEKIKLAFSLLHNPKPPTIQCLTWVALEKVSLGWDENTIVPFLGNVKNRFAIYNHSFNLLNYFLSKASVVQRDKTLFSYTNIRPSVGCDIPDVPYITWHVRYSKKWDPERNTADDEFEMIYKTLVRKFPKHLIVIVSDVLGCEHFKKLSKELGMKVRFSKECSSSFLGDAALILNSEYYFQLRGGGIGVFPIFSLMPYTRVAWMGNEMRWNSRQATSWQTTSQIFLDYDMDFSEAMIPCLQNNAEQ